MSPPRADADAYPFEGVPAYSVVEAWFAAWDDLDYAGADDSRRSALEPDAIIGFPVMVWDMDDDSETAAGSGRRPWPLTRGDASRRA